MGRPHGSDGSASGISKKKIRMDFHKLKWILFRISRVQFGYPKERTGYRKEYPKSRWITLDVQIGYPDFKSSLSKLRIGYPKGCPEISVDIPVDIHVDIHDIQMSVILFKNQNGYPHGYPHGYPYDVLDIHRKSELWISWISIWISKVSDSQMLLARQRSKDQKKYYDRRSEEAKLHGREGMGGIDRRGLF